MSYLDIANDHVAELYPVIAYGNPQLSDLPPGAIIGTWAYSVPGKVRFILARELELSPGVLPADLARAWIRTEYTLPFKRRKAQLERSFKVPLHAIVGKHGDCCYVDIKAAYLQILALGFDLEYLPGKYIGSEPCPVPVEIAANKFSYSIAVAMSGSICSNLQIMGKDGIFDHKPLNLYSNPCLFNLAQDTLNGIGAEILTVLGDNCVYINTDGFIIKAGFEQYALDIIGSWGFRGTIKHSGGTEVYGVGGWRIADSATKRHDCSARNFTSLLMARDDRRWLKTRMSRWLRDITVIAKA